MGTRCLTVFVDGETEIAVLYRQMDGYPMGHGKELATFLSEAMVSNGIRLGDVGTVFNGISDCAVRTISYLKNENGGPGEAGMFYLYPAKTRDVGEEYIYYITAAVASDIRPNEDNFIVLRGFTVNGGYDGHPREEVELDAEEAAYLKVGISENKRGKRR